MSRRQKHGVVTDGRITTFYGDAATQFMARRTAMYCCTQREAYSLQRQYKDVPAEELGAYPRALVAALRSHNFKIYKALKDKGL